GQIVNPLGAGYYQNYGRNELNIEVWNASLKGTLGVDSGKHFIQFGTGIEQTNITDKLYEWEYQDSAEYSLPVNTGRLNTFLNTTVKSQKSYQLVAGLDYNFDNTNRPFRITTEAYYKNIHDLIPYDIDNVRIRYFGNNNAKGYAYGLETRFYTELVKDAESWL